MLLGSAVMSTGSLDHRLRRRRVVILERSVALRGALLRGLSMDGYDVVGTGSVNVALLLVMERRVDFVVVNVRAYSVSALSVLARSLARRSQARLIATVVVITARDVDQQSNGSAARGRRGEATPWDMATSWLRLSCPEQLHLGFATGQFN